MEDSNTPATKSDLAAAQAALQAEISSLDTRMSSLDTRVSSFETHMSERHDILRSEMHHMQRRAGGTHRRNRNQDPAGFLHVRAIQPQRLAQVEGSTNAVTARLATLELRLLEVEKRLNMPPAA